MSELSDFVEDGPRSEIVQWFDEPVWRVQTLPTPVAFGAGLLLGLLAGVLAVRAWED